ncbi:AI-2E family transporter [bacterium]|nr:AI-2E family transporter [bacterium]
MIIHSGRRAFYFAIFLLLAIFASLLFLRIVIGPFLLAMVLAWLFNPTIERLEKRGVRRTFVVVFVLTFIISILSVAVWYILPLVLHQFEQVIKTLPRAKEHIEGTLLPSLKKTISSYVGPSRQLDKLQALLNNYELSPELISQALSFSRIIDNTRILAGWALALVLSPVFAFFLMRDFRRLLQKTSHLVPPDLRHGVRIFALQVDRTLRAVVRGQLLVVSLLSTVYATAFAIAGLPGGVAVGVLTGVARIIPYLDIAVGGLLSFLIILANDSPTSVIVGVLVCFALIQLLDAIVLTPKIMGQFSGLHPFIIIISVLCFGDWFGVYGVILAIPLASFGRVALLHLLDAYRNSQFYRGAGASSATHDSALGFED